MNEPVLGGASDTFLLSINAATGTLTAGGGAAHEAYGSPTSSDRIADVIISSSDAIYVVSETDSLSNDTDLGGGPRLGTLFISRRSGVEIADHVWSVGDQGTSPSSAIVGLALTPAQDPVFIAVGSGGGSIWGSTAIFGGHVAVFNQ